MINQPGAASTGPPYMGGFPVRCPRCSHIVSTRYCSHCGMDLSACYTVQQPPPRPAMSAPASIPGPALLPQPLPPGIPPFTGAPAQKHPLRNTLLICGISLACILLFTGLLFSLRRLVEGRSPAGGGYREESESGPSPFAAESYHYPQGISKEEFQKIKEGMSYALVCQIIGGEGKLQETGKTLQGDSYYTYLWFGEYNPSALAFITFKDGVVTAIAGDGLD